MIKNLVFKYAVIGFIISLFPGLSLLINLHFNPVNLLREPVKTWVDNEYQIPRPEDLVSSSCRAGVNYLLAFPDSASWLPTLRSGFFNNFSPFDPGIKNSEFSPQVRVRQIFQNGQRLDEYKVWPELGFGNSADGLPRLGWYIQRSPGTLWVIGNEMEVNNPVQDNIMPAVYAEAYHEIYHFIKGVDPTARVAVGAMSMGTPGRMQYLDIVWNTYKRLYGVNMPADAWTLHIYILPERTMRPEPQNADGKIALGTDPNLAIYSTSNPAHCPNPNVPDIPENDPRPDVYCVSEHDSLRIFQEQLKNMRTWMKDHGQQGKPLLITEIGLLYPYREISDGSCGGRVDEFGRCIDPNVAANYLTEVFNHLQTATDTRLGYPQDGYRLAQRWQWYSMYTNEATGQVSNLLNSDYKNFAPGDPAALSVVGQAFLSAVSGGQTSNLAGQGSANLIAFAPSPPATTSAFIRSDFTNTGEWSIVEPFRITFYADEALTQEIDSVLVDPQSTGVISGCNWPSRSETNNRLGQAVSANGRSGTNWTVSVEWPELAAGQSAPYWSVIDSGNAIEEDDEEDNLAPPGSVLVLDSDVFNNQIYVPINRSQ